MTREQRAASMIDREDRAEVYERLAAWMDAIDVAVSATDMATYRESMKSARHAEDAFMIAVENYRSEKIRLRDARKEG
jgi:hypothetical protein